MKSVLLFTCTKIPDPAGGVDVTAEGKVGGEDDGAEGGLEGVGDGKVALAWIAIARKRVFWAFGSDK